MNVTIAPNEGSYEIGLPPMTLLASSTICKVLLADDVDTVTLNLDLNNVYKLRSLLNTWLANHHDDE